jgi:predicted dehydrogenase
MQQAHEMFDKAREKGKLLMAAQLYRHDAAPRALKRIVETGVLGDIYHAESNAMRRLGIPTWGAFTKKSASAGGALFDIGVHMLDQTLWLMGNPRATSVSAVISKHFGTRPDIAAALGNTWDAAQFDVDDFGMAFIRLEGGADLILRTSWAAHIAGNQFGNTVLGTEGGITTEPPALYHMRNGVLASESYDNLRERDRHAVQIFTFLRAVRGDGELPVKEDETLNVQRVLNAAYVSAEEGREVATED